MPPRIILQGAYSLREKCQLALITLEGILITEEGRGIIPWRQPLRQ